MKLLADIFELEHFSNNSSSKFHYFIGLQKNCNIQSFVEKPTLFNSTSEKNRMARRIWRGAKGKEKGEKMV